MRLRDMTICVVCVFLAVGLLVGAGLRLDYINSQRQDMKLIINEPIKNAPPSLVFATVAMGAFRGLVVDILWMRAERLKEHGQFFDAKQLAEWITILQPRFVSVWEFHAWNMAYNISVAIPATQPDQRWQWVKNGYELLRDRGIEMNPKSILLYRELARIFQHKIGGITDEVHKYYKLQLATAMENLLGPADNQTFDSLAEAPVDWHQIIEDANVAALITALKSTDSMFENDDEFVNNYLSLRQNPDRFDPAAFEVIDDFRGTEALGKFDVFAKAYHLRKTWKLDPVLMRELNQLYGPVELDDPNEHLPLDWRHPDVHAIYWATRGLQVAGKKEFSIAETNTDRLVNHSLQNLFRNGKIFIYKSTPSAEDAEGLTGYESGGEQLATREIFLRPDLRMFELYNKSALERLGKYEELRDSTFRSLLIGHRNMLTNAVASFYQCGHMRKAQEIYNQLRQLYPSDEFKVPLVVFIRNRLREELQFIGINDAKEAVLMLLRESYFRYAVRDDDESFGLEQMAKEVYDGYQSAYRDENRINLPEFKLMRYFALMDFLNDWQYPFDLRRNLLGRIRIERPKLAEQLERQEEDILKQHKELKGQR